MIYADLIFGYGFYIVATVGTPGPNNIMIAASGANFGIKRSIPHVMGINLGFIFMLLVIGMGLGKLFTLYPIVHDVLRYVGAAFLLYLAYKIATSKNTSSNAKEAGKPFSFIQAAAFQWVNPKAWVMNIGAVTSFISIGGDKFAELSIMVILNLTVALALIFGWCLFGREIGKLLKSDRAFKIFNYSMAGLLVATVFTIFV